MTEQQNGYEHTEQEAQQLNEARQTLQILQEIREEQDQAFKSKPYTKEALEYHLISTEQDFLSVLQQNAEKNPKIWELYQQQKSETVDLDQFQRKQAERKYPTQNARKWLQIQTQLKTIPHTIQQLIKPANDEN